MAEAAHVLNAYEIQAISSLADRETRVLKHGETFAVFDCHGDIHGRLTEQGIYFEGTRHLSHAELQINGATPILLNSEVSADNALLTVSLTNPRLELSDSRTIPADTLHIVRSKFLHEAAAYERIEISSFGEEDMDLDIAVSFDADFSDIFEIRGMARAARGKHSEPSTMEHDIGFSYTGLDGVRRVTIVRCSSPHATAENSTIRVRARLEPHRSHTFELRYLFLETDEQSDFQEALRDTRETLTNGTEFCDIETSNELFEPWLKHSISDLRMLMTWTPYGYYPYAGVPWFSTVFGRDGILTAMMTSWCSPGIARGVLSSLAASQSVVEDPELDAEPGKIVHEIRKGEMAALREIPFGRYYGSVDATPLFIMLAGEYYRVTADRELIDAIWPNIELALNWIEKFGDLDDDGFVEYSRRSSDGLDNQGWKDSHDSVFHADGKLARGSIALCEVQGYVYAAWLAASELAQALGREQLSSDLAERAEGLRERFQTTFWSDDLGSFALALDGEKKPCMVRTSNAGHCLFSGIVEPEQARRLAETLLADDMFSGWGVRTVARGQRRYNPMSYHNGSVWPHDNAIVAEGLARYGFKNAMLSAMTGIFDASLRLERQRLPELFCGFSRREDNGPTLYPMANAPQAWSSAVVLSFLRASLGIEIDAPHRVLRFSHPVLPPFLDHVRIRNLRIGDAVVDFTAHRHPDDIGISIERRVGDVQIIVVK